VFLEVVGILYCGGVACPVFSKKYFPEIILTLKNYFPDFFLADKIFTGFFAGSKFLFV
jgi:hypothetical protein